jgi:hypothetical protein
VSIEAGVVIELICDSDGVAADEVAFHWHLPPGRSGGSLPDSPDLWQILWTHRDRVYAFAHSHPGSGLPAPSDTDLTTFAAVEQGLGKRLVWYICSSDSLVETFWLGPARLDYVTFDDAKWAGSMGMEHPWLSRLRELSGYIARPGV